MARAKREPEGRVFDLFSGHEFDEEDEEATDEGAAPQDDRDATVSTPGGSRFGYVLDGDFELMVNQALSRIPLDSERHAWLEALCAMREVDRQAGTRVKDDHWTKLVNRAQTAAPESKAADQLRQLDSLAVMHRMAEEVGDENPPEVWQLLLCYAVSDRTPTSESWELLKIMGEIWRDAAAVGDILAKKDLDDILNQLLSELRND